MIASPAPDRPREQDHAAKAERRVYIVDDDEAVRLSLAALLETEGYAALGFASAGQFLGASGSLEPGPVIADIRMPGIDGLELQRRLAAAGLRFPVIVITAHGDVPLAVRAMKEGAVDFLEKPFAARAILDSIAAAFVRLANPAVPDPAFAEAAARLALLSPRETQVLAGLVAGLPNKSIAYDLEISPRTVEIHRARVMDKMGARSFSELVRLALAAGVPLVPVATIGSHLTYWMAPGNHLIARALKLKRPSVRLESVPLTVGALAAFAAAGAAALAVIDPAIAVLVAAAALAPLPTRITTHALPAIDLARELPAGLSPDERVERGHELVHGRLQAYVRAMKHGAPGRA